MIKIVCSDIVFILKWTILCHYGVHLSANLSKFSKVIFKKIQKHPLYECTRQNSNFIPVKCTGFLVLYSGPTLLLNREGVFAISQKARFGYGDFGSKILLPKHPIAALACYLNI